MSDAKATDGLWRKSEASQPAGECVEVSFSDERVRLRHSKDPSGPVLSYTHAEWRAFLAGARNGEFDLP